MNKKIIGICCALIIAVASGSVKATLITIGTVQFGGSGPEYNLIADDDNNGNSLVWLDYTHGIDTWQNQMDWASGLNATGSLTYNIDPNIWIVDWGNSVWRLPGSGSSPVNGYNISTSEMGHLYYSELGLNADPSGTNSTSISDLNASNFDNLIPSLYWSETEYNRNSNNPDQVYFFHMVNGNQEIVDQVDRSLYGISVRNGVVTRVSSIPEPSTAFLFIMALFFLVIIKGDTCLLFR